MVTFEVASLLEVVVGSAEDEIGVGSMLKEEGVCSFGVVRDNVEY